MDVPDWDGATPLWQHCAAGGIAGLVQHVAVYPLDTLRTHQQSARPRPLAQISLWRGVQAPLVACVPAYALYFGAYERVKGGHPTLWGSAAVTVSHDVLMVPMDTLKQRMQLGQFRGLRRGVQLILAREGPIALFRSLPLTLVTNVPYGLIFGGIQELACAFYGRERGPFPLMLCSMLAGACAAAATCPLDRVKTCLQTQPRVRSLAQAAWTIAYREGPRGFLRGMGPRVLAHAPASALSWGTYTLLVG